MREKFWEHFKTVTYHRHLVRQGCFKVGLYRQGLLHDLSKYSPTEFLVGAKYYQGNRSPNNAEREATGTLAVLAMAAARCLAAAAPAHRYLSTKAGTSTILNTGLIIHWTEMNCSAV